MSLILIISLSVALACDRSVHVCLEYVHCTWSFVVAESTIADRAMDAVRLNKTSKVGPNIALSLRMTRAMPVVFYRFTS